MSLEAANGQDGGHSSTMDDHGVSNPPSMQVSDNGDGSNFVTRDELRAQFKNFESMLAQFQDNLVASWSHPSTQVGQQASNGNQTVLQGSQQFSNGRQPLVQSSSQLPGTSQPVAPQFLGLASQDPFASNFASQNPNSGVGHNIIPGIFPVSGSAFDLQSPPALTVAPNCSQVPYYLVDQIAAGLFIDFTLLLPENLGRLPKSMPTQAHLFRMLRSELKPLNHFRDWTQAWAVFAGVLAKKAPQMLPDVIAYFLLLAKTVKENPSANWSSYDKLFREKAALDKSLVWGAADPSLWVTHMLSRRISTHPGPDREVCGLFNQKRCYFSHCKFLHACQNCKSLYHPALECPNKFKSKDKVSHSSPSKKNKDRSPEKEAEIPLKKRKK